MKPLEIAARTFSFQLDDGRFIFRPWGPRGPCYLLSPRQRTVRAWFQLGFYVLTLAAIFWFFPSLSTTGMVTFGVAFMLLGNLLFWLFSIGLPQTEKPPTQTSAQRREALASLSRVMGKPLLLVMAVIGWLFVLAGIIILFLGEWIVGLLCLLFFGTCAALFTWQLRLIRRSEV